MSGRREEEDAPARHRSTTPTSSRRVRVPRLSVLLGFCVLNLNGDAEEFSTAKREGFLDALELDELDVTNSAHAIDQ